MKKNTFARLVEEVCKNTPGNIINKDIAITKDEEGITLFEPPLVGFADARDPLFETYKGIDVVGPWFMTPKEWMPSSETVISLFFPFTEAVRASNLNRAGTPSNAWLHGRVEGQQYINACMKSLRDALISAGYDACVPFTDSRFKAIRGGAAETKYDDLIDDKTYSSNWSERHAAYAAGLGTFGLSKCLITEKGTAGRFASILVSAHFKPDVRKYTGMYDYCLNCGKCASNCPIGAIDPERGKRKDVCSDYMKRIKPLTYPRHGCGLCYVGVPCETRIPAK